LYVSTSTAVVFTAFGYMLGRQADRLARLSETDALTGLINARGLYERLQRELARARRYGTSLALLVLDLDGLKIINDRFGHRAGDEALRQCAEVVRSELREADVGARWGGDEFAILAPDTSRAAALTLAERIRALIARRATASSPLSVSLGIAMLEPATLDADALMHAADAAMYDAKLQGRNRVVMAAPATPNVPLPRGTRRRHAGT
jgi:diguanylate cyclase (GGDEF)-like protein